MPNNTFHLPLFDQQRSIPIVEPSRPSTATQLVTAAHAVVDVVVSETIERTRDAGQSITCGQGCSACCQQLVSVSRMEALALAELVARMPSERQAVIRARFAHSLKTLRAAGVVAPVAPGQRPHLSIEGSELTDEEWDAFVKRYFDLHLFCPFIEDNSCSIYPDRPMICREYMVTSPVCACAVLDREKIRTVDLPIGISQRFYEASGAFDPDSSAKTALVLALEWAETEPPSRIDGRTIFSFFQMLCLQG